ncbi:MAG: hypothetical protein JXO49_08640 [Deltaproteobacteria bacterium]|nr:hypothetical protein [Candidatus Anaeroferrophillus wilburensis]MBN2889395.1 hypothetical protein [Deltaproteobacteria bacterium]
MIKKVLNITRVKQDLLRLVAMGGGEMVVTRDYEPVATLIPRAPQMDHAAPVLMVLGAKACQLEVREACYAALRRVAGRFSRIIFVYSRETEGYLDFLGDLDVWAVETEKKEQPIITSLKAALTCLAAGDQWFMVDFLNRPSSPETLSALVDCIPQATAQGKGMIVPSRNGKPSHPLAFSLPYKTRIIKTRKELGVPHIIRRHRNDVFYHNL